MRIPWSISLFFCFLLAGSMAAAQVMQPVDASSRVAFGIKNFGITVDGTFKGLKGTVKFDPAQPGSAQFDVSIDVATIETGIARRDRHLRSDDYFDVERYPKITIKGDKVTAGKDPGTFILQGQLTMKAVTRQVSIPFHVTREKDGMRFEGKLRLNRRDYNLGGSSISMGDQVNVSLQVFMK